MGIKSSASGRSGGGRLNKTLQKNFELLNLASHYERISE